MLKFLTLIIFVSVGLVVLSALNNGYPASQRIVSAVADKVHLINIAEHFLIKAASIDNTGEQGAKARFELGLRYAFGLQGFEKNPKQAEMYLWQGVALDTQPSNIVAYAYLAEAKIIRASVTQDFIINLYEAEWGYEPIVKFHKSVQPYNQTSNVTKADLLYLFGFSVSEVGN